MSTILNVATHSLMFFVMAIVFAGSVKGHSLSKGRREPVLFLLGSDVVLLFFKALQWFFRAGLFKAAKHRFAFLAVSLIAESSYYCVLLGFVYFLVDYLSKKTRVSVGRGTQFPFEIYGSPLFTGLSKYDFSFTPQSIAGATNPPFLGELCYGVDLRGVPIEEI